MTKNTLWCAIVASVFMLIVLSACGNDKTTSLSKITHSIDIKNVPVTSPTDTYEKVSVDVGGASASYWVKKSEKNIFVAIPLNVSREENVVVSKVVDDLRQKKILASVFKQIYRNESNNTPPDFRDKNNPVDIETTPCLFLTFQ